jgi:hypothetical protein
LVRRALAHAGYVRSGSAPAASGYIDAASTIAGARAAGRSVSEHVEALWDQTGATDRVIENMRDLGCLSPCARACEIGPGTGRYLERVHAALRPQRYDIYETADDWASWLAATYSFIVRQPADGRSLSQTPDASCGLVHAHGVFVYLPVIVCFDYFAEMCRVCAPDGHVVFDFYAARDCDLALAERWLAAPDRYAVVLPDALIVDFFTSRGFVLAGTFTNQYGQGLSRYLAFRRV